MEKAPSGSPTTPDGEDDIAHEIDDGEGERREEDALLVERARADPRAIKILDAALAARTRPILKKRIANGDMWQEARKIGIPAPNPNPPTLEPEEIESLAGEVIARALIRFHNHGLHKWTPTGGQAVTTWFYRDCLYQFSNTVRAWSKERSQPAPSDPCLLGGDEHSLAQLEHGSIIWNSAPSDAEEAALGAVSLKERLQDIARVLDEPTRRLVEEYVLRERRLTDVAKDLGISRQKASRMFDRCRKEMSKEWGDENHG